MVAEAPGPASWRVARADHAWMLAAVTLVGVFHLPSLQTGFVSDDAYLSLTAGTALMRDVSVFQIIVEDVGFFASQGRFFPLALTTMLNYALFPALLAYKLSKLVALMGVLGLWGVFVRRLTRCRATALLSVLLCGVLMQYRLYHDAVVSFGWQLPQAVALLLGGLLLQLDAEERNDRRRMVASAVLYTCSVMAYEIMLPLLVVHVALATNGRTVREAALKVAPHIIAAGAIIAVLIGLRLHSGAPTHPDTQIRIEPIAMVYLLIRQAWAALPLSYGLTTGTLFDPAVLVPSGTGLLLAAGAVAIAHRARTVLEPEPAEPARRLISVAVVIWLLAALMITPSAKYQREVLWGLGYLPVFVSVFGVSALIAHGLVTGLRNLRRPAAQLALIAILAPVVILGYEHNVATAETLATQWNYPRAVLTDALDEGLIEAVAVRNDLWVQAWSETPPWQRRALFALHGPGVPDEVWSGDLPPERLSFEADTPGGARRRLARPIGYITYGATSEHAGLAVGGIADFVTGNEVPRPLARRARIFVRRDLRPGSQANFGYFPPLPHGARLFFDEMAAGGEVVQRAVWIEREIHGPGLALRRAGTDWELWDIEATPDHTLALNTFRLSLLPN